MSNINMILLCIFAPITTFMIAYTYKIVRRDQRKDKKNANERS